MEISDFEPIKAASIPLYPQGLLPLGALIAHPMKYKKKKMKFRLVFPGR
jgi:hypothetical protein